jgi:hypothetical protein
VDALPLAPVGTTSISGLDPRSSPVGPLDRVVGRWGVAIVEEVVRYGLDGLDRLAAK